MGGVSKHLLEMPGGSTLVQRTTRCLLRAGATEVFASVARGNGPGPEGPSGPIPDIWARRGPLGGIASSVIRLSDRFEAMLICPCDLPLLTPAQLGPLMRVWSTGRHGSCMACASGSLQPLCAVVERELSEKLRNAVEMGHLAVGRLWLDLGVHRVAVPDGGAFTNVNTVAGAIGRDIVLPA